MGNLVASILLITIFSVIVIKLVVDKKKGYTCSSCRGCKKSDFCKDKK